MSRDPTTSSRRVLAGPAAGRVRTRTWTPAQWGMVAFLVSEVAFFSTLIVAYLTFLGKDTVGPTPARGALAAAGHRHDGLPPVEQRDDPPGRADAAAGDPSGFSLWWAATIGLGRRLPAGHGLRVVRADHASIT